MLKASDVMTKGVETIYEDKPIFEAIKILAENEWGGLPVVSKDGDLKGVISDKDLLRLLYRKGQEEGTVKDYMTREVVCFEEEDSLKDICESLMNNVFRRVPILSKGKLVGIVSRSDLMRFILKLREEENS